MKNKIFIWCGLWPSLIGVGVFYLLPFMDVIRRSFYNGNTSKPAGFHNYIEVVGNEAFILAVKNTLRFTVVGLPLLLSVSFVLAILLERQVFGHDVFKGAYLIPLTIPASGIVFLWQILFAGYMKGRASFYVLVLSYVWKNLGYSVVLWLAGLSGIPKELYEAARMDGAGETSIIFRIILPNIKPATFTIGIISFLNSFKVYREAWLVAGSYPNDRIYLIQHLFNNWFRKLDINKMAAASVIMALFITAIVFLLTGRFENEDK